MRKLRLEVKIGHTLVVVGMWLVKHGLRLQGMRVPQLTVYVSERNNDAE